ncbi:protein-methionine-sulfoxide reductase heme-binding subunit MsrQ [Rhizobium sp. CFBP 8762]|uniref:protein-methionine-sulfoxide reductase heme-binding subunit MsrQ n=1 Tax=Rhizobium sp. CFBP 8762 TaxID=2775279 RepID=UPI0017844757|nr:protein-methionine-sulfoxide reductase heme-binding subunit MsrQ [Rhizobium sp. CFBP 8762]MBD8554766.1 protein-methionine-sulfoxide reductase heme-binding subunit MsrQ [Rhizobium sp. CFBP 8762]
MRKPITNRTPAWVNKFPWYAVYIIGLLPAMWVFYMAFSNQLGGNPVRTLEHTLGIWALRFIIIGLMVTPLRKLAGINLLRFRRAFGLIAFYYAALHFSVYAVLDQGLAMDRIINDIIKRPYIIAGMVAFVILIALAMTSNSFSIKKLGGKGWSRLHKLVYLAAASAALHFVLSVKSWPNEPLIYAGIIAVLLGYRLVDPIKKRMSHSAALS